MYSGFSVRRMLTTATMGIALTLCGFSPQVRLRLKLFSSKFSWMLV